MKTETVLEPARKIPVSHTADLVVAGGGTAGVAAAVVAARMGLSVVMVERTAQPGGMVTHVTSWLNDFRTKGGFAREFFDHVYRQGIAHGAYYNPFRVVPWFDRLIADAGVRPLYLAWVAAPLLEDGRVAGVIIESKSGRTAVRARTVVDATGDGDVAALAGAPFAVGRESDGAWQAVSLTQLWTNYAGGDVSVGEMAEIVRKAAARAGAAYELPYDRFHPRPAAGTAGSLLVGVPHVSGVTPLSADGLSECLVELRRQALEMYTLLAGNAPEFAGIEFGPFGGLPGVRESRRIVGDYVISKDDLLCGRRHEDGLFTVEQNMDFHRRASGEPAIVVERTTPYQVPYRALLPRGVENLLTTGRCISGSHESLASHRIIADCLATGEAAALAAWLAKRDGTTVREIPAAELVAMMRDRGYAALP